MVQRESVVTPERFATGLTYQEYLASLEKGKSRFDENYRGTTLASEDVEAFRHLVAKPQGPARVLVLTEYWCPDCYRETPVMAKVAEAAGMELRVFPRDENLDIMNEFLKRGEFQSIPVFAFYTGDHRYLGHWIERSKLAEEQQEELRRIFEGRSREEAREEYMAFQRGPLWERWRQETVGELRQLLESVTP